jgi:hypothetical protein
MARLLPPLALVAALLPARAGAQQARVTLDVDRHIVRVGEQLRVTVGIVVEGQQSYDRFVPPTFGAGFQVAGGGMTTQNVEIINWRVRRRESHIYTVVPVREGRLTIGPAAVILGGRRVSSPRVAIQVRGGGTPPPAQPDAGAPSPGLADRARERVFIAATAAPRKVFLGQQLVVTWQLYTQSDVLGFHTQKQPTTDNFWTEDLRSPRRLVFDRRVIENQLYYAAVIARRALFPQKTGTLTVGPLAARVRTLDQFTSSAAVLESETVSVEVLPLPTKDRPSGFQDQNVGQDLDMVASIDRQRIKAGEGVTLKIVVSGHGNLRQIQPSPLDAVDGFKVYKPKVEDRLVLEDGVSGEKVLEYLLLPVRTGRLEIPALHLDYFDPVAETYRRTSTEALSLTVTGKMPAGGVVPGDPGAKNVIGPNIRPPRPARRLRHQQVGLTAATRVLFLILAAFPVAFVLLWGGGERLRARLRRETAGSLRRAAGRRTRRHLRRAAQLLRQGEAVPFYAAVAAGLRSLLDHKLGLSIEGLTRPELAERMRRAGFPDELVEAVAAELEVCDAARFAPAADQTAVAMEEALSRVQRLLDRLGRVSVKRNGGAG